MNEIKNIQNIATYTTFFEKVHQSIANQTFAKLTLAKTVGNPDLKNIYVRVLIEEGKILLAITYRYQTEEIVEIINPKELEVKLIPFINNPFLSVLLFTIEADITMKLNKKRIATIIEQLPTFKHADANLLGFATNPNNL